jgi:hypothetical protein
MHAATQSAPQCEDAPLAPAPIDAHIGIIGGGPSGSTAAALPLSEQLGCAPAVKKVGLIKNSVQFHSMEQEARQTFAFADAWEGVPKYAYQVRGSFTTRDRCGGG